MLRSGSLLPGVGGVLGYCGGAAPTRGTLVDGSEPVGR
jgi:hypothetical protein